MPEIQKELTRAELQIMQILWSIEKGFVNDILVALPEPRPAYNTVSTIVRILEKKGFVSYVAYGKTHEYFPLISKEQYTREYVGGVVKNYFQNSFRQMLSFFANENKLSVNEIEEIRKLMEEELERKKNK
ncbi:MAG: BlaI/MecI/CopY family transcriptional regulator [Bacteroidales bacterium]|nr:BlaI/MecI/CopY family transcriptional regulator [Bacteroidales bacterium]HOY39686.1 BlaI/MecI/CopY family transcriptional regulator [Bacteroidales bacterium]HQP03701.1 BlaI/MecI/CopY family transcriptional regulator [Bacteroidales bacterium]